MTNTSNVYFLIISKNNLSVENVYERLLTIVTQGIEYTGIIKDDVLDNAIRVSSNIDKDGLFLEISEVLDIIGYTGKFYLLHSPIFPYPEVLSTCNVSSSKYLNPTR